MDIELRLYDTAGNRQPLPDRFVAGWEFELLPRGGYGSFNLRLLAEIDESEISLPAAEWTFEAWLDGRRAYRGRVERVRPAMIDPKGRTVYPVEGVGRMGRVQTLLADCQFTRPGGTDVADVYAWLAGKFLQGDERLGDLVTAIETPIGYTLEHVDLFGSTVRQAFDKLAEAAQDLLIWGLDVDAEGNDRLYVRTRATSVVTDDFVFWVGKDVSFLELPADTSELINAIRLVGGKAKAPNLVFNPSFELPFQNGSGPEGTLLLNGSFENDSAGWTYEGGAARQQTDGEAHEYSHLGNWMAEIDNTGGDAIRQTVNLADQGAPTGEGNQFRLEFWHTLQNGNSPGTIRVTVFERDGGDSGGSNIATALQEDLEITARQYQQFSRTFETTNAGTTHLRVKMEWLSGGSVFIDDVYLFEANQLIQEGWQRVNRGAAAGVFDWANEEDPYHGAYCVRVEVSGADGSAANCVRIRPTKANWAQTRDATQQVFKVRIRGPVGASVRLGLQRRSSGGGTSYQFADEHLLAGSGDWELLTNTISSGDATEIRPVIELRSNGVYYLDAVELYEAGIEVPDRDVFLDGENLVLYFRTDNGGNAVPLDLAALSADAAASIATYGLREEVVEVEEIQDLARAKDYAIGYFNRQAVPLLRGRLTLERCDVHLRFVDDDPEATPLGMIRVGGLDVTVPDQNAARILYSMEQDGALRCEVDLTTVRPEVGLLLAEALGKERDARSGGGGGAGTNLSNGSGGGSSGGDEGTAPTWQVDDTDVGQRSRLNLKGGTGIELAGTDDESNDAVGVTFTAKPADFHQRGVHADRPAAGDVLPGTYWTSVDQSDGTTYRSDGSVWEQIAGPATTGGGAGGAGYTRYDGWRRTVVDANTGTSYGRMEGYDGLDYPDPMPYAGTLWAVAVAMDAALATSQTYDVQVYRSSDGGATWSATGLVATVSGAAVSVYGRQYATAQDGAGIAFSAGDLFALYDRRSSSMGSRSARAYYLVTF